jgi:hypothetical protein
MGFFWFISVATIVLACYPAQTLGITRKVRFQLSNPRLTVIADS